MRDWSPASPALDGLRALITDAAGTPAAVFTLVGWGFLGLVGSLSAVLRRRTVRLSEVYVDPGWVGTTIGAMSETAQCPIPFLTRFGAGMVPNASTIFQDGDLLYVAVHNDREADVEQLLGAPPEKH